MQWETFGAIIRSNMMRGASSIKSILERGALISILNPKDKQMRNKTTGPKELSSHSEQIF